MSEKDSLRIIQDMIDATKHSLLQDGVIYIYWGWIILFCSLGEYLLMLTTFKYPYLTWLVMPFAVFRYMHYVKQRRAGSRVKSYIDEYMSVLWRAFIISASTILCLFPVIGYERVLPLIIILYGIGTYTSGGVLRFPPLTYGGLANYPLAIAAFFTSFQNQLIILSIAVLVSYIIPGYLLKANFKSRNV
ncbi:hypothetical protein LZD49_19915 [Dyadobacter sp. CY261]|uniref:hypothetical protein n=1 Tax=Dyadobacter sp. CY261 TaxID=2907203 RepID=UPI001F2C7826|nr:hypothetical protein [Dyadobacter sp. CY261]MCF0072757.1 hypothetical protein [Dyadobacter sp. CY261]